MKNGVKLMKKVPSLDSILDAAAEAGIFGTKMKSVIKSPDKVGIPKLVQQQFQWGLKMFAKGLVPVHLIEVENKAAKAQCEELLVNALLSELSKLQTFEKVVLWLSLPSRPNGHLQLMHHPNVIRVVASSGSYSHSDLSKLLADNVGLIAGFGRAVIQDLRDDMSDDDFTTKLDSACQSFFKLSKNKPVRDAQMAKITFQRGCMVPFDQASSIPAMVEAYGADTSKISQERLEDEFHKIRTRIMCNPKFNGSMVFATVLTKATCVQQVDGMPTPKYLWEVKRIVPFMKIESGLQQESDGVRLMKQSEQFDDTMETALASGCLGVKLRIVIRLPKAKAIEGALKQMFSYASRLLAKGLVPLLQVEVEPTSPDAAACEKILRQSLKDHLNLLNKGEQVMFSLCLPVKPNTYKALSDHRNTIRIMGLQDNLSNDEAMAKLEENDSISAGLIKPLLHGLSARQTEQEFTKTLEKQLAQLVQASN